MFLNQVSSRFRPSVGIRVSARRLRDFSVFSVCLFSKNFPSARCTSAVSLVYTDAGVFGSKTVSVDRIL